MPNQSLPDLTERTATADSDLIHVNSGGSDYKQTKANFLADYVSEIEFNNTSLLTTQVDALPVGSYGGAYTGKISSYGHQSETGVPENDNYTVEVSAFSSQNKRITIMSVLSDKTYTKTKLSGTWGSWILVPRRDEITSLNNSFANRFVNLGSISATNLKMALIAAFDKLSVHDNPVIGTYSYSGAWMFWGHKYTGDLHGMMLAITYYPSSTSILLLNRSNGVDTVRAVNLSGEI